MGPGNHTPLPARLAAIVQLVQDENKRLDDMDIEGFLAYQPMSLAQTLLKTLPHLPPGLRSLDMGAGTGAWWLFMAAMGVPSYAIEIHPELVVVCERLRDTCRERGLIDQDVPCVIACGDMIPPARRERYAEFRRAHGEVERSMPGAQDAPDPYKRIGIPLSGFGVIYCWAWPTQSRFLFNLLAEESGPGAVLVLPAYERYTTGEHMNAAMRERNTLFLKVLATHSETVIGTRISG